MEIPPSLQDLSFEIISTAGFGYTVFGFMSLYSFAPVVGLAAILLVCILIHFFFKWYANFAEKELDILKRGGGVGVGGLGGARVGSPTLGKVVPLLSPITNKGSGSGSGSVIVSRKQSILNSKIVMRELQSSITSIRFGGGKPAILEGFEESEEDMESDDESEEDMEYVDELSYIDDIDIEEDYEVCSDSESNPNSNSNSDAVSSFKLSLNSSDIEMDFSDMEDYEVDSDSNSNSNSESDSASDLDFNSNSNSNHYSSEKKSNIDYSRDGSMGSEEYDVGDSIDSSDSIRSLGRKTI